MKPVQPVWSLHVSDKLMEATHFLHLVHFNLSVHFLFDTMELKETRFQTGISFIMSSLQHPAILLWIYLFMTLALPFISVYPRIKYN